jgi:hypothetical protein
MTGKNPLGSGKEPQSYEGINIIVPIGGWQVVRAKRDPTANDKKYPVATLWVNTVSENVWVMTQPAGIWSQLAASGSSDVLGVVNGGTGNSTLTTNGILLGNGTSAIGSTAALANGQTLIGSAGGGAPVPTYISNAEVTYVPKFTNIPSMSASTGGVAAVTINTYNIWSVPQWGASFEQYNTTVSTAIAPSMSTTAGNGLDIDTITGGDSKSIEITEGNTVNSKNAFVIGTSPAFYVKAGFNISTLADIADLYVGFRKVQTYQATIPAGYTDYATIGVHGAAGAVELQTQVSSGGNTVTNTTNSVTAATNYTVEVLVSSGGVVTYLLNGTTPTTVAAYTFTSALTVVPYIIYTTASGGHAEVDLVSYQCGFQ